MAKVIVSYSRESEHVTRTVIQDIEALGYDVWFDQELSGGQVWWDQILERIRDSDIFIFVLSSESLNSIACKREYGYAANLGKPILPILVSVEISINLLPPELSKIQFVDYRKQDRDAVIRLARALKSIPPRGTLPDPLPTPPDVPIAYLGNLSLRIETESNLSYEQQSALLIDLKRFLRDPETAGDTKKLLKNLKYRRDVFKIIVEEIDELLDRSNKKLTQAETDSPIRKNSPVLEERLSIFLFPSSISWLTQKKRVITAFFGGVIGLVFGLALMGFMNDIYPLLLGIDPNMPVAPFPGPNNKDFYPMLVSLTGAGGAVAGAICGTQRKPIKTALICGLLGWIIPILFEANPVLDDNILIGGLVFAPFGVVIGAIIGTIMTRLSFIK